MLSSPVPLEDRVVDDLVFLRGNMRMREKMSVFS